MLYLDDNELDGILGQYEPAEGVPQVQAERGFLADTRTGVLRGVNEFGAGVGRIGEAVGIENQVEDRAAVRRRESPWLAPDVSEYQGDEGFIKRSYMNALEAGPSSVIPGAIGGTLGFFSPVPGGAIAGAAIGASLFTGGSEGRAAYERGIAEGMGKEEAFNFGIAQGVATGSLEGVAMAIDVFSAGTGRLATTAARTTLKSLLTRGPAQLSKDIARIYGTTVLAENVTEQAQLEAAAAIDRKYGLKGEVTWAERAETAGTTTMLSLMFGTVASTYNVTERSRLRSQLNSKDPMLRAKGLAEIEDRLRKQGNTDIADQVGQIDPMIPVKLDDNIARNSAKAWFGAEAAATSEPMGIERLTQEIATEEYQPAIPGATAEQKALVTGTVEQTAPIVNETLSEAGIPTSPVSSTIPGGIAGLAQAPASNEPKPGPNLAIETAAQGQVSPETLRQTAPGSPMTEPLQAPVPSQQAEGPQVAVPGTTAPQGVPGPTQPVASNVDPTTASQTGTLATPAPAPARAAANLSPEQVQQIEVEEAADVMRRSKGAGVTGTEEAPSPAEIMEARETLVAAGYDPENIATESVGETAEATRALAEGAPTTSHAAMILGELESEELREYVDGELKKLPTTQTNTDDGRRSAIREILIEASNELENPEAQAAFTENIEPYVDNYKGKSKVKTTGDQVTWTYDEEGDFHMGTALDGKDYWITKLGKGRHMLIGPDGELGVFDSPESAKQHLSGSGKGKIVGTPEQVKETKAKVAKEKEKTEAEGYSYDGKGKAWKVLHKGEPLNPVLLRSKGRAAAFRKLHNANPKLKIGDTVTALNNLNNQKEVDAYVADVLSGKGPSITEKLKTKEQERKARVAERKAAKAKRDADKAKGQKEKDAKFKAERKAKKEADAKALAEKLAKQLAEEAERKAQLTAEEQRIQKEADEFVTQHEDADGNKVFQLAGYNDAFTKMAQGIIKNFKNFQGKHIVMLNASSARAWLALDPNVYDAIDMPLALKRRVTSMSEAYLQPRKSGVLGAFGKAGDDMGVIFTRYTLNEGGAPATASSYTVLAHELGHMYMAERWDELTHREKMSIYKEWLKSEKAMRGAKELDVSVSDFVKMTRGYFRWQQHEAQLGETFKVSQMENNPDYYKSFDEWFADQVAKWSTTEAKPLTAMEEFFSDLAAAFKTILNTFTGQGFVTSPVMRSFMNGEDFVAKSRELYGGTGTAGDQRVSQIRRTYNKLFGAGTDANDVAFDDEFAGVDIDDVDDYIKIPDPKPLKKVGNLTMLSPVKAIAKDAGVFKGMLSAFGINSPTVYVADVSDLRDNYNERFTQAPAWIQDIMISMNQKGKEGWSGIAGATEYDPETNEALVLVNKELNKVKSKEARYETMAHEAGHILERILFHSAPVETQKAIMEAWRKHTEVIGMGMSNMTIGDFIRIARSRHAGMAALDKGQIAQFKDFALDNMSKQDQLYYASFEEWFADNVAKWAATDKAPKGLVEEFFKGLYDRYKKLVAMLKGQGDTWYDLPDAEVAKFLDDKLQQATNAKEARAWYAPEQENVIDEFYHEMFRGQQWEEAQDLLFGKPEEPEFVSLDALDYESPLMKSEVSIESEKARAAASTGTIRYSTEEARAIFENQVKTKSKVLDGLGKFMSRLGEESRKAFASGIDVLNRISPELGRAMTNYARKISERNATFKEEVAGYAKAFNALKPAQQREFDMYVFNGERDRVAKAFPEMVPHMKVVDAILENIRKETEKRGAMPRQLKYAYFPRKVNDNIGLQRLLSDDKYMGTIDQEIEAAERKKGEPLNEAEREEVVNQMLRTGRYYGSFSTPGSLKERTINKVDPEMMKYYSSSLEAIYDHAFQMNEFIERQNLIGSKGRMDTIRLIQRLQRQLDGKLQPAERKRAVDKLTDAMNRLDDSSAGSELETSLAAKMSKFFKGQKSKDFDTAMGIVRARILEKGMHGTMNTIRNIGLISTLSDFTALITQASELLLNIYENGPKNALLSVFTKPEIDAQVFDLKSQQMEWQREGSAKWVSKVLTAVGFSYTDIYMKQSFMTASLMKARKQITKNSGKFKEQYEPLFKGDTAQLMKELASEETTELVREFAFAKLMNYQPLDVIANPQAYMTGGNLRILYMLKTFSIRQANAVYREGIHGIIYGNKKEKLASLGRLTALGSLIVLGGATKDEMRDFYLGREVPMRDHIWDNVLNVILLSRYDTERFATEGLGKQIFGSLRPPTPWIDSPYKDIMGYLDGKREAPSSLKLAPVIGKGWYDRFTEAGRKKEYDRRKTFMRDAIKDDIGSSGRVSPETRRRIRVYNRNVDDPKMRLTTSSVTRTISAERKKLREATR